MDPTWNLNAPRTTSTAERSAIRRSPQAAMSRTPALRTAIATRTQTTNSGRMSGADARPAGTAPPNGSTISAARLWLRRRRDSVTPATPSPGSCSPAGWARGAQPAIGASNLMWSTRPRYCSAPLGTTWTWGSSRPPARSTGSPGQHRTRLPGGRIGHTADLGEGTPRNRGPGPKSIARAGVDQRGAGAVLGGVGLAVLSRLTVAADLGAGSLVEVPIVGLDLKRPLQRYTRPKAIMASATRKKPATLAPVT